MERINLRCVAKCSLAEVESLPENLPGIYIWFLPRSSKNEGWVPIYIGESGDIRGRVRDHRTHTKNGDYFTLFAARADEYFEIYNEIVGLGSFEAINSKLGERGEIARAKVDWPELKQKREEYMQSVWVGAYSAGEMVNENLRKEVESQLQIDYSKYIYNLFEISDSKSEGCLVFPFKDERHTAIGQIEKLSKIKANPLEVFIADEISGFVADYSCLGKG